MPDYCRPAVVVEGAPELGAVPPEAWQRLVDFFRGGKTGSIVWAFNDGRLESVDAREHIRVRRRGHREDV